jgi:methionyl-tRNA formyltransferase
MKCVIVTSDVTYIPRNYRDFTKPMSENEHIAGLVLISNNAPNLALKAAGLIAMGARKIGLQLLKNSLGVFRAQNSDPRIQDFTEKGKWAVKVDDINQWKSNEELMKRLEGVELIVNARTRCIYKESILALPKFGCVNIHHGILPNYRGTMCDFYALTEGRIPGFTIHSMNKKIDDGKILKIVERPWNSKSYFDYLNKSGEVEAKALAELMRKIQECNALPEGFANTPTNKTHTRNPTRSVLKNARNNGFEF